VLLSTIDSSPRVSEMADLRSVLRAMDASFDELGRGIVIDGSTLLSLVGKHDFLHGFDEVWLFTEKPSEDKPEAIPLTSDVHLQEQPSDAVANWMQRCGCIAGLGDGDGLNFVTLRPSIAELWST
jgi:hypothetical protein